MHAYLLYVYVRMYVYVFMYVCITLWKNEAALIHWKRSRASWKSGREEIQ